MFAVGQGVKVIGGERELKFFYFDADKIYHVKEYNSPEECAGLFPNQPWWQENGGRVVLEERPKLEWFGKRFKPAEQIQPAQSPY